MKKKQSCIIYRVAFWIYCWNMHSNLFTEELIAPDCSLDYNPNCLWGGCTVLFVGYDKLYVFGWILDSSIRHKQGATFCFGLGKRKALIKPIHKDYMWQSAAMHSAAQHGSMFCSFSCPHHQLNVTQCSPSWGLIRPVKLPPSPPRHTHRATAHM